MRRTTRWPRYLWQHSTLVSTGHFPGRLYHFGRYPGAVYESDATTVVHGEVYAVRDGISKQLFTTLDHYEGDEYMRAEVPVRTDQETLLCWTYLFTDSVEAIPLIESGRFY